MFTIWTKDAVEIWFQQFINVNGLPDALHDLNDDFYGYYKHTHGIDYTKYEVT